MGKCLAGITAVILVCAVAFGRAEAFAYGDDAFIYGTYIRHDRVPTSANTPADPLPFYDVSVYHWYYNAVVWAFEKGLMNGLSEHAFAPEADMTRAMLVTILWRYAGEPAARASAFVDVQSGRWYSAAVAWAARNGIVTGISATEFSPHSWVTREQMYTILYRYMNFAGLTIVIEDTETQLLQFADEDEISDWALDAMYFMFDAGVMFRFGTLDMYARPGENAFRGEIAAAMYFFDRYSEPLSIVQ